MVSILCMGKNQSTSVKFQFILLHPSWNLHTIMSISYQKQVIYGYYHEIRNALIFSKIINLSPYVKSDGKQCELTEIPLKDKIRK